MYVYYIKLSKNKNLLGVVYMKRWVQDRMWRMGSNSLSSTFPLDPFTQPLIFLLPLSFLSFPPPPLPLLFLCSLLFQKSYSQFIPFSSLLISLFLIPSLSCPSSPFPSSSPFLLQPQIPLTLPPFYIPYSSWIYPLNIWISIE